METNEIQTLDEGLDVSVLKLRDHLRALQNAPFPPALV